MHAALTPDIVEQGLEVGFALADELSHKGYQTIAIGTVGERSLPFSVGSHSRNHRISDGRVVGRE